MFISLCFMVALGLTGIAYAEWNTNVGLVGSVGTGDLSMTVNGHSTWTPLSLDITKTGAKEGLPCPSDTFTIVNTGSVALEIIGFEVQYINGSATYIEVDAPRPTSPIRPGDSEALTVTVTPKDGSGIGNTHQFRVVFRGAQANGGSWETADVTINGTVEMALPKDLQITHYTPASPATDDQPKYEPSLDANGKVLTMVINGDKQKIKDKSIEVKVTITNLGGEDAQISAGDVELVYNDSQLYVTTEPLPAKIPAGQNFVWSITIEGHDNSGATCAVVIKVE